LGTTDVVRSSYDTWRVQKAKRLRLMEYFFVRGGETP